MNGDIIPGLVWLAIFGAIYFLPAIVANSRDHRQTGAIVVLNLLAGWTVVGWVVAIVWASTADVAEPPIVVRPERPDHIDPPPPRRETMSGDVVRRQLRAR